MKIIGYTNCHNIDVEFSDGYVAVGRDYRNFKSGRIRSDYFPSYLGVGYLGVGEFSTRNKDKTGHSEEYIRWGSMLTRCYSEKYSEESYEPCYVCEEWHNFQNFARWYSEHKYEIPGESLQLDKDIKYKGNHVYSPETCLIVPRRVNSIILNRGNDRGNYAIGVQKKGNLFLACCNRFDAKESAYIGSFKTELEAFNAYKKEKEMQLKKCCEYYRGKVPKEVIDALQTYKVEIGD